MKTVSGAIGGVAWSDTSINPPQQTRMRGDPALRVRRQVTEPAPELREDHKFGSPMRGTVQRPVKTEMDVLQQQTRQAARPAAASRMDRLEALIESQAHQIEELRAEVTLLRDDRGSYTGDNP